MRRMPVAFTLLAVVGMRQPLAAAGAGRALAGAD